MWETYLPFVTAIVVGTITFAGNYYVGKLKTQVDAAGALRDDLIDLVGKYESREKTLQDTIDRQHTQNQTLQETTNALRLEVNSLRIENQSLKAELQVMHAELKKFERKVFYTSDSRPENKTGDANE
jgi:predicted RNase H-like nuclease (RuvC/YqgF family)